MALNRSLVKKKPKSKQFNLTALNHLANVLVKNIELIEDQLINARAAVSQELKLYNDAFIKSSKLKQSLLSAQEKESGLMKQHQSMVAELANQLQLIAIDAVLNTKVANARIYNTQKEVIHPEWLAYTNVTNNLSNFIVQNILVQADHAHRIRAFERWNRLLQAVYKRHDFFTANAIASALAVKAVNDLKLIDQTVTLTQAEMTDIQDISMSFLRAGGLFKRHVDMNEKREVIIPHLGTLAGVAAGISSKADEYGYIIQYINEYSDFITQLLSDKENNKPYYGLGLSEMLDNIAEYRSLSRQIAEQELDTKSKKYERLRKMMIELIRCRHPHLANSTLEAASLEEINKLLDAVHGLLSKIVKIINDYHEDLSLSEIRKIKINETAKFLLPAMSSAEEERDKANKHESEVKSKFANIKKRLRQSSRHKKMPDDLIKMNDMLKKDTDSGLEYYFSYESGMIQLAREINFLKNKSKKLSHPQKLYIDRLETYIEFVRNEKVSERIKILSAIQAQMPKMQDEKINMLQVVNKIILELVASLTKIEEGINLSEQHKKEIKERRRSATSMLDKRTADVKSEIVKSRHATIAVAKGKERKLHKKGMVSVSSSSSLSRSNSTTQLLVRPKINLPEQADVIKYKQDIEHESSVRVTRKNISRVTSPRPSRPTLPGISKQKHKSSIRVNILGGVSASAQPHEDLSQSTSPSSQGKISPLSSSSSGRQSPVMPFKVEDIQKAQEKRDNELGAVSHIDESTLTTAAVDLSAVSSSDGSQEKKRRSTVTASTPRDEHSYSRNAGSSAPNLFKPLSPIKDDQSTSACATPLKKASPPPSLKRSPTSDAVINGQRQRAATLDTLKHASSAPISKSYSDKSKAVYQEIEDKLRKSRISPRGKLVGGMIVKYEAMSIKSQVEMTTIKQPLSARSYPTQKPELSKDGMFKSSKQIILPSKLKITMKPAAETSKEVDVEKNKKASPTASPNGSPRKK